MRYDVYADENKKPTQNNTAQFISKHTFVEALTPLRRQATLYWVHVMKFFIAETRGATIPSKIFTVT